MSIPPHIVRYKFGLQEDGEAITYDIDTDFKLADETVDQSAEYPDWTRLERNQCKCCPLKTSVHTYCPAAIRIHSVLERFKGHGSIQKVDLTVETEKRNYSARCDLQSALNSMIGLQMATSGCPVVGKLRYMATFHVPLSSFSETLYRGISGYLTKQYFKQQAGEDPDWELLGLREFYLELETLNRDFSMRINEIEQNDAISNTMVIFFSASLIVADLIEDGLEDYKNYFTGESSESPD
jgi:hypothetical protein